MKEQQGDLQRLKHILDCIIDLDKILEGTGEEEFYRNKEKKYAVERILEIIGEAVNKISDDALSKSTADIPWRDIVAFRNIVSHEYFRVDYTMVFKIATEEIPGLQIAVEELIDILSKNQT